MMRNTPAILFLLLGIIAQAAELMPVPDLKSPAGDSGVVRDSGVAKLRNSGEIQGSIQGSRFRGRVLNLDVLEESRH
jgi:hypothetical protein